MMLHSAILENSGGSYVLKEAQMSSIVGGSVGGIYTVTRLRLFNGTLLLNIVS